MLYPAMIVEFVNLWILKLASAMKMPEQYALLTLLIPGLLVIFIHLFVSESARQLVLHKRLLIGLALESSIKRYVPAVFFGVILPAIILAPIFLLVTNSVLLMILTPLVFLLAVILGIYPVVYVLSSVPAYRVYQMIWLYFRRKPWQLWRIFLFFMAVTFGANILVLWMSEILPGNYSSLLVPIFSGLRTVFLIYGIVILFLGDQQISELA